jgi:hypothetical protein
MPVILPAPCELVGNSLSASPGFSYGRAGNVATNTFLNRPGGTPSNNTGVNFGLLNGSLDVIATGTRTSDTYELTIYQHDGNFASPTTIAVVTVTALTKAVLVKDIDFTQVSAMTKNRQIAVEVSSGSANNIGVDLQLSGDVSV